MTGTNQKLREVLQEMIDMMDSGAEHGAGSPWYLDAKASLALPTADHISDAGEMVNGLTKAETDASASVSGLTAAPVGERERFETWWRSVQLMTLPKEYDIERLQDWGSIYKPKALDAWQARAALIAGDAVDAQRYRLIRRGQHFSIINGIGDMLRGENLDAAIDAAMRKDKL